MRDYFKKKVDDIIEFGEDFANWIGIIFISLFANVLITVFLQTPTYTVRNGLLLISALFFLFTGWKFLKSSSGIKKAHQFWELNKDNPKINHIKRDVYFQQLKTYITKRWTLLVYPAIAFIFLFTSTFPNIYKFKEGRNENVLNVTYSLQDYNDWFKPYDAICNKKDHHKTQYQLVSVYLSDFEKDTLSVYDIASGTGHLYKNLKTNTHHLLKASDGSKAMIDYAIKKHNLKDDEILQIKWQELNKDEKKYDLILLLGNSIASVENKIERDSIINNIISILNPNGKLLIDFDFSMSKNKEKRYGIEIEDEDFTVVYSTKVNGDKVIERFEMESIQFPDKKIKPKEFTFSKEFTDSLFVNEYFKKKGDFRYMSKPKEYRFSVFELTEK